MKLKYLIPFLIFVALVALFAYAFRLDPREVPSPLVGKPAPTFALPRVDAPETIAGPADLRGRPWMLNVWATWCVACREEHAMLMRLAREEGVTLLGLNYKEIRGDASLDMSRISPREEREAALLRARDWLARHGDPYRFSVLDLEGRVAIDYGVYGVPETFLIDAEGVIRYKHIGPIDERAWREVLQPKWAALGGGTR
ncbi:MAG: DsbE family thiol:disulfide interchange protein [Tepidiphilus sp.]